MQIDRFNYLQFPLDSSSNAVGNDATKPAAKGSGGTDAAAAQTQAKAKATAPVAQPASPRAESVVLNIQWPGGTPAGSAASADATVYANTSKATAVASTADTADAQLQNHQQALQRSAGSFTQLTVGKDGVLVAKPQIATEAKQPDFVSVAVSAMREISDEAQRQKLQAFDAASTAASQSPATSSNTFKGGLQQLAARFNVFA